MNALLLSSRFWYNRNTRLAGICLSWIALALGCWIVASVVYLAWITQSALPYWDQWDELTPSQVKHQLFAHHNEHLIFIPRLIFLLDFSLVHGNNAINICSIYIIQFFDALLLAAIAAVPGSWNRFDPLALGLSLSLLFSAYQFENLFWGFQSQFVGVYAFATGCFVVLFFGGNGIVSTLGVCLLGAAAALTMANGIIVLPVAAALTLIGRHPMRQTVVIALAAVAVVLMFTWTPNQPGGHTALGEVLHQPLRALGYLVIFFGSPIAAFFSLPMLHNQGASLFGAIGIAWGGRLTMRMVFRRDLMSTSEWVLGGVILFIIGSALLVTIGRLDLGVMEAASSRYGTPALIYWCALLLWTRLILTQSSPGFRLPAAIAFMVVIVGFLNGQSRNLSTALAWMQIRYDAESALIAGAPDLDAYRAVNPSDERVLRDASLLRAQALSIYAEPYAGWMGQPLESTLDILPSKRCSGALDTASLHDDGGGFFAVAAGWAWDIDGHTPIQRVLLVNNTGRIVGFGRGPYMRMDVVKATRGAVSSDYTGWAGHAVIGSGSTLRAYGLIGNRAACPLAGTAVLE